VRPFRDQPIGRKMTLLLLSASAVVLLLTAGALVFYEVTTVQPRVLRDLRAQADLLRTTTAAALRFGDARAARENLSSLRAKPEIGAAALYTTAGAPFASYVRRPVAVEVPAAAPAQGVHVSGRLISLTQPVRAEGELVGTLALWYELPPFGDRLLQYAIVAIAVLTALAAVALLLRWLLRTNLSSPLLTLADTARAVTERGDYSVRATKHGDDEVGQLTEAFNAMLDTIQARDAALQRSAEQLVQSQKMEAIGRLAGGIAHDFNNLLTAILGYARFARAALPKDSSARGDIEQIEEAGIRAASLTAQLLAYARRQMIAPKTTDLNGIVAGMEDLLRRLLGEDVVLKTHSEPELWRVRVDPGQLEQVILNLAVNARDAMPGGGTLTIETCNVTVDPVPGETASDSLGCDGAGATAGPAADAGLTAGEYVALLVRDTGVGMDEATSAQVFEPFFTTKEQGKGTGLGLAVCYGIVKQAEGHIVVDTAPGAGATFTVYLPRETEHAVEPLTGPEPPLPEPTGDETILVVEDDAAVRSLAVRTLRELGYTVLEAGDGAAAERVAAGYGGTIHLLLVDVVMPGIDGNEVANRLVAARPQLHVLYMSGYTDHPAIRRGVAEHEESLINKPFAPAQLARAIRSALDGVGSGR
jgi:signal transduction histidine kinase